MRKSAIFSVIGIIFGVVLFVFWMGQWFSPVQATTSSDSLWRSVARSGNNWERKNFEDTAKFLTYQKAGLLIYGSGQMPIITEQGSGVSIQITTGSWIIRLLEPKNITISGSLSGSFLKIGGIYVDTSKKIIANFDSDLVVNNKNILPSFLLQNNELAFFDIREQTDIVTSDVWDMYVTFFPRDQEEMLGNISKKTLDATIRSLLEREPKDSEGLFFRQDISARNGLTEIQDLTTKIYKGEACGGEEDACYTFLDTIFARLVPRFPETFITLQRDVYSWIQMDPDLQDTSHSWDNIFRRYHMQLIAKDEKAQTVRDKAILNMIKSANTSSYMELWMYLSHMLASQKLGSAYSLQILREMLRIGDELLVSQNISDTDKGSLSTTAVSTLSNLKNMLENTYFTKKEYWFVLRNDIVDEEGNQIQTQVFVDDLQKLIQYMDNSTLVRSIQGNDEFRIVRGQLNWFTCIFAKNSEYVNNPRICRTSI